MCVHDLAQFFTEEPTSCNANCAMTKNKRNTLILGLIICLKTKIIHRLRLKNKKRPCLGTEGDIVRKTRALQRDKWREDYPRHVSVAHAQQASHADILCLCRTAHIHTHTVDPVLKGHTICTRKKDKTLSELVVHGGSDFRRVCTFSSRESDDGGGSSGGGTPGQGCRGGKYQKHHAREVTKVSCSVRIDLG